jgi:flagellar M-ring protein FliF
MFNDLLDKSKSNLVPWWQGLTGSKKISFVFFSALTVVLVIIIFNQINKASYQVLYRNLEPQEAGQIIDQLKAQKISYQISQGGTEVLVPESKINDIRLSLASQGYPKSGVVGYEIFDQTNLGMTDFLQKVNYRRALEGELTKTIASLKEVKTARVHLVIPEQRLFKEDEKEPTASVVLYLDRSMPLSQRQIEGIAYLVSSSVEGLPPENVTILDASGKLLSERRQSDALAKLSSNQLDMKKSVEAYLQDKAQSMLDGVVGPNRAIVRVSADLNFDQLEQTNESYNPDSVVIRSEEITEENQSQTDSPDPTKKKDSSGAKKTTVRNYEVTKKLEHLVSQVGNVKQLRVSLSVDGSYTMVKGADGKMQRQYAPRSQEDLDKLLALVRGAVGFTDQRGDIIEVANLPFETYQDDWEEQQKMKRDETLQYWLQIAYRILAVLAAIFVLLKLRKSYASWSERRQAHQRFMDAQAEIKRKAAEIIPKVSQEPKLIDHIRKLADDNPQEIAKVIKTMMAD